MKPIDMSFSPCASSGTSSSPSTCSSPSARTMVGRLGPCTSTSTRPTLRPAAARAQARLTAVVDLPTPPLQLATATIRPTDPTPASAPDSLRISRMASDASSAASGRSPSCGGGGGGGGGGGAMSKRSSTSAAHGSPSRSSCVHTSRRRPSAPASAASRGSSTWTVTEALSSPMRTARTSPSETMSGGLSVAPAAAVPGGASCGSAASLSSSSTSDCLRSAAEETWATSAERGREAAARATALAGLGAGPSRTATAAAARTSHEGLMYMCVCSRGRRV
mmetsp:Transcript_6071/g.19534  ORF Transcript_6071/g.19534 Transcript_6071/m.19534 type:complete len:278 (+) Transcript_6071:913-1746(+)